MHQDLDMTAIARLDLYLAPIKRKKENLDSCTDLGQLSLKNQNRCIDVIST